MCCVLAASSFDDLCDCRCCSVLLFVQADCAEVGRSAVLRGFSLVEEGVRAQAITQCSHYTVYPRYIAMYKARCTAACIERARQGGRQDNWQGAEQGARQGVRQGARHGI